MGREIGTGGMGVRIWRYIGREEHRREGREGREIGLYHNGVFRKTSIVNIFVVFILV